jgi:hypothetical protein
MIKIKSISEEITKENLEISNRVLKSLSNLKQSRTSTKEIKTLKLTISKSQKSVEKLKINSKSVLHSILLQAKKRRYKRKNKLE